MRGYFNYIILTLIKYFDNIYFNKKRKERKNEIKYRKLADEISFRLLATRKHSDFEWLVVKIRIFNEKK